MSAAHENAPLTVLYSFPHTIGEPGIGWTAWNQVTELVAAGHLVTLVTTGVGREIPGLRNCVITLRLGRFRLPHRLVGRDRAFRHHDRAAAAHLARGGFDVVHTWPLAAERTLVAARRIGAAGLREAPNTHTAHAYAVAAATARSLSLEQDQRAPHTFNRAHLCTEEREWAAADGILAPSEPVRRSFLDRGFADWRVQRHQYGHRITAAPENASSRPPPFTALFLGRGEPRKGLHLALAAWRRSAVSERGRFVVRGRIEPAYRALIEETLASPGVVEAGFTDDPASALREADVLLLPSLEEGSALVTYEAQAQGCVPLVSEAAGAMLDHEVHGLVHEAGDVETLARHLDRLASDADELGRLRAAAVAHAAVLTWTNAGVRLVDAYRKAITRVRRTIARDAVAVVVCSRDRPEMLEEALNAILAVTPTEVEVLVVDSGSRTAATRMVARRAGVDCLRSDLPGLSIARNLGWRSSDRAVVVYTDDDCRPTEGWIDLLLGPFSDPSVGAVTGRMLAQEHRAAPPPYHRAVRYDRIPDGLDAGHGALMAFRRDTLERLGGFDDVLGAGRALAGAEDLDMFCRVIADGGVVMHCAEAVVVHENTRVNEAYVRLQGGYGRGLGGLLAKWLREKVSVGLPLAVRVTRRSVRRTIQHRRDPVTRRSERAFLHGVATGVRAAWRTPLHLGRLADLYPPAPVLRDLREVSE